MTIATGLITYKASETWYSVDLQDESIVDDVIRRCDEYYLANSCIKNAFFFACKWILAHIWAKVAGP